MATSTTSTSGIAGLDVQSLVSQLMSVERQPINKLNTKVTDYQNRISSFGTISGLVSSLQTAAQSLQTNLHAFGATSSDTSLLSASATSSATAGNYSISVTHLAQAQSLVAAGQASQTSAITSSASTVTFKIGTTLTDVTVGAGATLQDIRDAINGANLGVTATIINDGSGTPYRLALTANDTGTANGVSSITVQSGGDAALNDLLAFNPTANAPGTITMTETAAARDASLTVNGIPITSASNAVTDAIQGVTLNLKGQTTTAVSLTVARDTSAISSAASGFVTAYNSLMTQLKSLSAYGSSTTTAGALSGDGTVRQMISNLRDTLSTATGGGTLSYLAQVGITSQSGGTLALDSTTLTNALNSNFSDVDNLFNNASSGFITRLTTWTASVIQTGGLISQRTTSLNDSISGFNDQINKLEVRMTALQKQYTTTYTNLNMLLSSMNDTSKYLTSQFG